MIKHLQSLKARKGFTLVELIVVIAIIAVLAAITIVLFSSDDGAKQAADIYASDFYASLQYNLTRYETTDYYLSPNMKSEATLLKYDSTKYGNVFADGITCLYIEGYSDDGLQYVHVESDFKTLMDRTTTSTATSPELERLLLEDMKGIINQSNDGYYYAVVIQDGYDALKVITTHYCDVRLPAQSGALADADTYKDELMFTDYGILKNGQLCGTCSSSKDSNGVYIGDISSYLLGLSVDTSSGTLKYVA